MINNYIATKDINTYNSAVSSLRKFFASRGFIEVHTQDRLSILAACEDPTTIATFNYDGSLWPLPQTGQMWLEYELLKNSALTGVFCVSTSYRQEPNPVPGRHEKIFPMFEFEAPGSIENLQQLEIDLCEYLGLGKRTSFAHQSYDDLASFYGVGELAGEEELKMEKDFGRVTFVGKFPVRTSPFWNMKKSGEHANKIDVVINGMETIGSAERSTNKGEMRHQFHTISNGLYARRLFDLFGQERVEKELEGFLSFDFFPRFGGGIGLTRLMRALAK